MLVPFLIACLVICVIVVAIRIVLSAVQLPAPIAQLVWLIVAVLVIVALYNRFGGALGRL